MTTVTPEVRWRHRSETSPAGGISLLRAREEGAGAPPTDIQGPSARKRPAAHRDPLRVGIRAVNQAGSVASGRGRTFVPTVGPDQVMGRGAVTPPVLVSEFAESRLPAPGRGDHSGGSLMPPVPIVVPGHRRSARRAWPRGRSGDQVPAGAALHPPAGRGGPGRAGIIPGTGRRGVRRRGGPAFAPSSRQPRQRGHIITRPRTAETLPTFSLLHS